MGDASFMLNNTGIMNISCQNSLQSYPVEGQYRSSYTSYPETSSLDYFVESQPPPQQHIITSSTAMPGFSNGYSSASSSHQATISMQYSASLRIIEGPMPRMRYRYKSEKGAHGGLQGLRSTTVKKTYPKVELLNAPPQMKIYVQASLYTCEEPRMLHVHKLVSKSCSSENGACKVKLDDDNTATFSNLWIMFTGKKEIPDALYVRKLQAGLISDEATLREECRKEAKSINVNKVVLCFQAFQADTHEPISDRVFSDPVLNQKSPESSELKIVRISRQSGVCTGNDEVFLFCEKVNKKDIRVKFFEEDNDEIVWEEFGIFQESDVHHQLGIVFRTPPYRDETIQKPVVVYLQLYRPKDGEGSAKLEFCYTPVERDRERIAQKKRKVDFDDRPTSSSFHQSHFQPSLPTEMKPIIPSSFGHTEHFQGSPSRYQRRGTLSLVENAAMVEEHQISSQEAVNDISDLLIFNSPENVVSSTSETSISAANAQVENMESSSSSLQMNELHIGESIDFNDLDNLFKDVFMGYQPDSISHQSDPDDYSEGPSVCAGKEELNAKHTLIGGSVSRFLLLVTKALRRFLALGKMSLLLHPLRRLMAVADEDGDNALHYLAISKHSIQHHSPDVLQTVWKLPRNIINQTNNQFQTPLQLAVAVNKSEVVFHLLKSGADPNIQDFRGCSAVHLAVIKHYHSLLDVIVKTSLTRLDLNMLNYDGLCALHIAVQAKCRDCVLRLCSYGADVNKKDGTSGRTALHMSVQHFPEIIDDLLRQEAIEIDTQDYTGNTALHLACVAQNLDIALKLMAKEANPLIENFQKLQDDEDDDQEPSHGTTPYDYSEGNEKLREILAGVVSSTGDNEKCCDVNDEEIGQDCSGASKEEADFNTAAFSRDSGFISGEVDSAASEGRISLCEALDPPNTDWEKIADVLCDKNFIPFLRKCESSPTRKLLEIYNDDEIPGILEMANLEKYIPHIMEGKRRENV